LGGVCIRYTFAVHPRKRVTSQPYHSNQKRCNLRRGIRVTSILRIVVGAGCLAWCAAYGDSYQVAGTSDGFGPISTAIINKSGVVAFYGERRAASGERFRGIYKGKTSVITLMEDSIDNPPPAGQIQILPAGQGDYISLNAGGKVAWWGKATGSNPVVYVSGGPIVRARFVQRADGPLTSAVTITDDGFLAYDRYVRSPTPGDFAYAIFGFNALIGLMNNAHQFLHPTSPATNYLRLELGFPRLHDLAVVQTNLLRGVPTTSYIVMNDNGTVAFFNSRISGNTITAGIYKYSGGAISTVVEMQQNAQTGVFSTEFGYANGVPPFAINNKDQVAFYAKSRTLNRDGVFRGSSPLTDKIVAVGDFVYGLQMNSIRAPNSRPGFDKWFNDAGQIVFVGSQINGASGLFVTSEGVSGPAPPSVVDRWNPPVSPPSGSFGVTNNWQPLNGDPPRVPQKTSTLNDTALFDRPEAYTVELGQQHAERLIVKDGNVTFTGGALQVDAVSFDNPSVIIDNARLTLSFPSNAFQGDPMLTCNHALIGRLASRVDVNNNAGWLLHGSLRVGGFGEGILTIDSGGSVTSAEGRIGGAGGGHVNVGASGEWTSGNLAIGIDGGAGDLTIQDGGTVTSESAVIGQEAGSGNRVIVQGSAGADFSTWFADNLLVGSSGDGRLEVTDGASVKANILKIGNEALISGLAVVSGWGTGANSTPSDIMTEFLFVGARGSLGELRIEQGGLIEASGEQVYLGSMRGRATVIVDGVASGTGDPSTLRLTNPNAALGLGDQSAALLVIRGGGLVELDPQGTTFISSGMESEPSEIVVEGANSKLETGQLSVGTIGSAKAFVTLVGGTVDASSAFVGARGVIRGVGTLTVDPADRLIVDGGTISPGLSPGVLTIQGNYEQRFDGNLLIEIGGTNSTAQDRLIVTGDAQLDGIVTFRFINGFAPKTGDRVDFLNASTLGGAFASVGVQNLAPGFQFDIVTTGSSVSMSALNDAVFDPALPGQVLVTITNMGGITYAVCTTTTSNSCDRIAFDGPLTRVNNTFTQAFEGTRLVGGDCFPETATATNILVLGALAPGSYTFNIVSAGQIISTIPFTAVSSGETLFSPARASDGSLQFQLNGPAPVRCIIEVSPDLIHWTELESQTFPANFTDFDAALFPQRFYRARIGP
jgi:T5SS/PEP-CTERM-associated repeat protein